MQTYLPISSSPLSKIIASCMLVQTVASGLDKILPFYKAYPNMLVAPW